MKRLACYVSGLLALVMLLPSIVQADTEIQRLLERIESLETQMAQQQRAGFASYQKSGDSCAASCTSSACDSCASRCCSCPTGFVYGSYEALILRPYVSNANFQGLNFDDDFGVGHRFVLGAQNASGLGGRVRYLFYNHGIDVSVPNNNNGPVPGFSIDLDVLDVETTLSQRLCNWNLEVSGGLRYARFAFENGDIAEFEGTGPTASLQATRQIGYSGLHLLGNARTSLLMGDVAVPNARSGPIDAEDEIATVFESQLGVGYARELGNAVVDFHVAWETQVWMNDTIADDFNGLGSHLGLSGVVLGAELRR